MSAAAPQRALVFEHVPPLSMPLRFFLTAPVFALLAAALLYWHGEAALLTRWSPLTLAVTHLMVLGCLSMTMVGALLQMLPVVAGIAVPRVGLVAPLVHGALTCGTLLLAAAFWRAQPALFAVAGTLLVGALLLFLGACTVGLWQQHVTGAGEVVAAIRQALAALAVTLVLGALLAGAFAWPAALPLPLMRVTDLHAMWGLLGWIGLPVIGVALQVVPMFMLTEPYPPLLRRGYTTAVFVLLMGAGVSSGLAGAGHAFHLACVTVLALAYAGFAVVTLALLARRKRPRADTTTLYWRTAMLALLAATSCWGAHMLFPALFSALLPAGAAPLAIGVLAIGGVALSAINGMLYKIVPFLVWYHVQHAAPERCGKMADVPSVNRIIPERRARWQFAVHCAALLALLGACCAPALLARPAAALMGAASLTLWCNMALAVRLYRRHATVAKADGKPSFTTNR